MILFDSLMLFASWLSFDVVATISRNGRFTGFGSAGIQIQACLDGKHPKQTWDLMGLYFLASKTKSTKRLKGPAKTCSATIKIELNHFEPPLFVSREKGRHVPSCKQQGNREIEEKC